VASVPTGAYTAAERQSALTTLGRFGWRHEFDADRDRAQHRFWDAAADLLDGRMPPEVAEQGEVFFQDWFTTDFRLESGSTLIELLLDREGRRLRTGEVRYLSRARLTHLRPYEVVGVRPDEGLDLLDLWVRKPIRDPGAGSLGVAGRAAAGAVPALLRRGLRRRGARADRRAARPGRCGRGSAMRVPVDWDDLGMALTADPAQWSHYLDRRTGEVQMVPVDRLERLAGGGASGGWPGAGVSVATAARGCLVVRGLSLPCAGPPVRL
jgi:hypothetical protein